MLKNRKIKIVLIILFIIITLLFSCFAYILYEAEKMFYRYANDGDKWVCEKYNITLHCYVEENGTKRPFYYLETDIEGIEQTITISDFRGGHAKTWNWYLESKDNKEHIPLLLGDYYIKNKNTLEFTINSDGIEILDGYDDSLASMFEADEKLLFKRIAK